MEVFGPAFPLQNTLQVYVNREAFESGKCQLEYLRQVYVNRFLSRLGMSGGISMTDRPTGLRKPVVGC
jgi:hypothetical protein